MVTALATSTSASPVVRCCNCGTPFWMADDLYGYRIADHESFYCPNGHRQHFLGESDAERYKRLLRQAEDRVASVRAERDQAEASRRAWKGQTTRLRNRAAAGACPFCGESVYQMARHVERKHPDEAGRVLSDSDIQS